MDVTISLVPEVITEIGGFPITNSFFMTIVVSSIVIIGTLIFHKKKDSVPRGFQNFAESILEALLNLVDGVTGDRVQTRKFFPIVATIFIFVIISNWIGLLPGMGTIGFNQIHHGEEVFVSIIRSPSADLNTTAALAIIAVIAAQMMGITAIGVKKYAGKFFVSPFKKPYFIGMFVGVLEIISEFAKIISFSFRLFGNVFAGEVLLLVMLALIPLFVPLPFLFLEVFVGFIQALVFAMLTLVFFKMATEAH